MKRVAVLSHSVVPNDPRVSRQCIALYEEGFDVLAIGLEPPLGTPSPLEYEYWALPYENATLAGKLRVHRRQSVALLLPSCAERGYWQTPFVREAFARAAAFAPDMVIANDWATLPLGVRLKAQLGATLLYDTHEFAIEELSHSPRWNLFYRPYIAALEQRHIGAADAISTVSRSLADGLVRAYRLDVEPVVIRNMPVFEPFPHRGAKNPIRILYHGLFQPDRSLESLIWSVRHWPANMTLWLRGYGKPSYERRLRGLAEASGEKRIHFLPAVQQQDLVRLAHAADVGIFVQSPDVSQARYALPNKLFEYIMAGLCVCVSDNGEMPLPIREFDCGIVVSDTRPERIAATLQGLSPQRISRYKRNALTAAKELSWQKEKGKLLDAVNRLAGQPVIQK